MGSRNEFQAREKKKAAAGRSNLHITSTFPAKRIFCSGALVPLDQLA